MNTDGSGITAVSNSAGDDREPSWSFDGAKIVFVCAAMAIGISTG